MHIYCVVIYYTASV